MLGEFVCMSERRCLAPLQISSIYLPKQALVKWETDFLANILATQKTWAMWWFHYEVQKKYNILELFS